VVMNVFTISTTMAMIIIIMIVSSSMANAEHITKHHAKHHASGNNAKSHTLEHEHDGARGDQSKEKHLTSTNIKSDEDDITYTQTGDVISVTWPNGTTIPFDTTKDDYLMTNHAAHSTIAHSMAKTEVGRKWQWIYDTRYCLTAGEAGSQLYVTLCKDADLWQNHLIIDGVFGVLEQRGIVRARPADDLAVAVKNGLLVGGQPIIVHKKAASIGQVWNLWNTDRFNPDPNTYYCQARPWFMLSMCMDVDLDTHLVSLRLCANTTRQVFNYLA